MRRLTIRSLAPILSLGLMALGACASPGAPRERLGDPDLILREEIDESSASNAFDLVRNSRPQWLQTRGIVNLAQAAGAEGILVYMDNARLGLTDTMRRIPLGSVQYLQFFTAREATLRWGGGHLHGAILISTQSR